jgi:hypothetical protein
MARVVWEVVKAAHCDRVGELVTLEVRRVYPADVLPDQPPRVLAHRCSRALQCNQMDRPTCRWAGTLPGYDPFAEAVV